MPAALRKLVVGALLVLGLAYFALVRDDASAEGLVLWTVDEAESALDAPGEAPAASSAPGETPEKVDGEAARPDAMGDRPQVVFGRVVSARGEVLGNIEVRRSHPYLAALTVRADASGRFQMNVEAARGELEPVGEDWVLLGGRRHLAPEFAEEYLLVVAPRAQIVGRVLDPNGAPLADVLVRLSPPSDALVPFGVATPPIELDSWRVWTSATGGFRFHDAPLMEGVVVEAEPLGLQPARESVQYDGARAEIELRMQQQE